MRTFWAATIGVVLAVTSQAQTIFQHSGSNNPTSEGFTVFSNVVGTSVQAFPTNVFGTNAWAISDAHDNYRIRYDRNLTSAQTNLLYTNGWQLQWSLNIVSGDNTVLLANRRAIELSFVLAGSRYDLQFGKTNAGDHATVRLIGPVTDILLSVPGGASGFHTWELYAKPYSSNVAFLMDGVFLTNYSGFAPGAQLTNLFWGSVGDAGQAHADWGMLILQVPEPSALGILSLAALMAAVFRRR